MIDVHSHLDYFEDPQGAIREIESYRVRTIAVSMNLESFRRIEQIAAGHPLILPSIGIHPEVADEELETLDDVLELVERNRFIGEIGLDRYFVKDADRWPAQERVLRAILERCHNSDKVLNLHVIGAERLALDYLGRYNLKHVILHWYTSPHDLLPEIARRGYFISINPAIERSRKTRELVKKFPRELIVTETDGPGWGRDAGKVYPGSLFRSLGILGELWGCSAERAGQIVEENFARLIS